jgi:hypothetical protein
MFVVPDAVNATGCNVRASCMGTSTVATVPKVTTATSTRLLASTSFCR